MNKKQGAWVAFILINAVGVVAYPDALMKMWFGIAIVVVVLVLAVAGLMTFFQGYDALGDSQFIEKDDKDEPT